MSLIESSRSPQNYLFKLTNILQGGDNKIINNWINTSISPYDKQQGVWGSPLPNNLFSTLPESVSFPLLRCEILPNQDSFGLTSPFGKVNNSKRISLTIKSFMENALAALNYFPPKLQLRYLQSIEYFNSRDLGNRRAILEYEEKGFR